MLSASWRENRFQLWYFCEKKFFTRWHKTPSHFSVLYTKAACGEAPHFEAQFKIKPQGKSLGFIKVGTCWNQIKAQQQFWNKYNVPCLHKPVVLQSIRIVAFGHSAWSLVSWTCLNVMHSLIERPNTTCFQVVHLMWLVASHLISVYFWSNTCFSTTMFTLFKEMWQLSLRLTSFSSWPSHKHLVSPWQCCYLFVALHETAV